MIRVVVDLPDDLVAHLDRAATQGRACNREEAVARLIRRDERRQRTEEDLRRSQEAGTAHEAEMLAIARATSTTSLPFD